MKEVHNQNLWNCELGSLGSMKVPISIFIVFQQRDRQNSQSFNFDTFCMLSVTSAQSIIGTEKYPDAGILINYDDDDYSQGYGEINEAFRASIKNDIVQPYISDDDFGYLDAGVVELCYILHVFDMKYQQKFTASQPIEVEYKVYGDVLNDINGYALV